MPPPLSPETWRRVEALFPSNDWELVTTMLEDECGNNLPYLDNADEFRLERFRFAALKLSDGDLGKLESAIHLAKTDWRDLLVAAGFADDPQSHINWFPIRS